MHTAHQQKQKPYTTIYQKLNSLKIVVQLNFKVMYGFCILFFLITSFSNIPVTGSVNPFSDTWGIQDLFPGGSYWINKSGLLHYNVSLVKADYRVPEIISLKNDFVIVRVASEVPIFYNRLLTFINNKSDGCLFKTDPGGHPSGVAEGTNAVPVWYLDGNYMESVYGSSNNWVYFFDWKSSSWKIWTKHVDNNTHGMPKWDDYRFKQVFKWRYRFDRSGYPIIEIIFLMTAQDPYVRILIDSWSRGNHTLMIPISVQEKMYYLEYNDQNRIWSKIRPGYTPISDASLTKNLFAFFDKPSDKIGFISFNQKFGKGNDKSIVVWDDTNNNGKPDKITFILNFNQTHQQNFLSLALGYIPNQISMEAGNPSTWKLEDGRTMEQIAEDTLTYYDINSWEYHNLTNKVNLTWNEIPNDYGISGRKIFGAYNINTSNCNQIGKMGYYTTLDCRDTNPIIFTQKQQVSSPSWVKGYIPNQTQWEKLVLNKSVQTQKGNITIQIILNKSEIRSVIAGIPGTISNLSEKSEVPNLTSKKEKEDTGEGTGFFDRILDGISKAVYRIMSIFSNKKG